MKYLAFVVLVCIASSSRLRIPVDEQLAQIDQNAYGKTLLDTIQIQMDSGASVDIIVQTLDELAVEMNNDQVEDDRLNVTRQNECETEIAEFDRRIDYAQSEINAANIELARLRPLLATTQDHLSKKSTEMDTLSTDVGNLKAAHSGDTTSYADRIADHKAAIAAIEEAIVEMNRLIGSEAGEGIHESSERIGAEVKAGVLVQVQMLSKLAAKADQDAVQMIIDELQKIKENLEASIEDEGDTNNVAIVDYSDLLAAMEHTLNDLTVAKAQLEEDELRYQAEIGTQEARLNQNTDELNAATNEKNAKINQCIEWSHKYVADTQKRHEELDIVAAAKDIFVNQLGDMSDYLSDRVEY